MEFLAICYVGIGDENGYSDPHDFLLDLAEKYVGMIQLRNLVISGNSNIELARTDDEFLLIEHVGRDECYTICVASTEEELFSEENKTDILSALSCGFENLLNEVKEIVMLPIFMYEHGGCTISTGSFGDPWDSGQIGYIYTTKEDVLENTGCKEDVWRKYATQMLEDEIELYDKYIKGEVYGFKLFHYDEDIGEWEETEDSCYGFFGTDILKSGLADEVFGLSDAIKAGTHETGAATCHKIVTISWQFD